MRRFFTIGSRKPARVAAASIDSTAAAARMVNWPPTGSTNGALPTPLPRRHHDRPGAEEFYRRFKRQSHLSLQFARARPRKLLFEHYLQPDISNQHQYRRRQ